MTETILELQGVQKSFGGLRVCDDISLELVPGELHALIGPNGAGNTTLLNIITGLLPVDRGKLLFRNTDITTSPVHERARLGMARSFQITSLFPGFTVQQNMELAVQATRGSSYRFWKRADTDSRLHNPARKALARIGLADRAPATAANLSHGEQRLLEIGMALATDSELLLIDEPMAGLGPGSARNLADLIRGLKGGVTILLVEHDMQAVFSLADRITVLVEGRVAASGPPEQIRNNPAVQEAYLGAPC
jgi:branched-chain amino acid transport system ATP-binding protein